MDQIGIEDALIQKRIIYSGSKFVPLVNGTKVCSARRISHFSF